MTTESFPPKNAICRDDGGGGNRTRESFPPVPLCNDVCGDLVCALERGHAFTHQCGLGIGRVAYWQEVTVSAPRSGATENAGTHTPRKERSSL